MHVVDGKYARYLYEVQKLHVRVKRNEIKAHRQQIIFDQVQVQVYRSRFQ